MQLSFLRRLAGTMVLCAALPVPAVSGATPEAAPVVAARGPVTGLPLPRFVSMRADSANARRGPSLDQRVDWQFLERGMPLEITAEYGNWRRVRDADGAGGWVHHTLLSGVRTARVQGSAAVALRAEPDAGPVRAMAEPGAIGQIEACTGAWCEIDAGGVEGWVPRAMLWGVTADEVIE